MYSVSTAVILHFDTSVIVREVNFLFNQFGYHHRHRYDLFAQSYTIMKATAEAAMRAVQGSLANLISRLTEVLARFPR